MEASEQNGTEVEGPDAVIDLLQTDVFLEQAVADVDPAFLPSDAAVFADLSDLEVSWVLRLRQAVVPLPAVDSSAECTMSARSEGGEIRSFAK